MDRDSIPYSSFLGVLRGWVFGKTRGMHAVVADKHYLYILFGLSCWIV